MRIVVIGIGNPLMGDDGFGVEVVEKLKGKVPNCVELYKCEALSFQVLNIIENSDATIIVDVIKSNGNPGDIYVFDFEEVNRNYNRITSLHDLDIVKIIEVGRFVYNLPKKIVIVGVEPEKVEFGIGLSEPVRKAIPKVVDIIVNLIYELMKTMLKFDDCNYPP